MELKNLAAAVGAAFFLSSSLPSVFAAPPSATFLDAFGTMGAGDGQFVGPGGSALNHRTGKLYILDTGNSRIQRFSLAGDYETQWGAAGAGIGQFSNPLHLAVNETTGDVYVTDYGNDRVQRFNREGAYVGAWGTSGTGDGQFQRPIGIGINQESGDVYVSEFDGDRVQQFTATGAFVRSWGSSGTGAGQFDHPSGIAVNARTGQVYVADGNNNRIQRFDARGTFQITWGSTGSGDGQFLSGIGGLLVDNIGRVFAADLGNNRIQIFNTDGGFLNGFAMPIGNSVPFSVALSDTLVAYIPMINRSAVSRWQLENTRPTLTLTGRPTRTIHQLRAQIRGTAVDDGLVRTVKFRVGTGSYRNARGLDRWRSAPAIPPGRSRIQVRAQDNGGLFSRVLTVRVTRR